MQSVPITTKVVSWNPSHGEVYSVQFYVIEFVSDLWHVAGFLQVLRFPPPIKLTAYYNWNIVWSGIKHHNPNLLKWFRSVNLMQYGVEINIYNLLTAVLLFKTAVQGNG